MNDAWPTQLRFQKNAARLTIAFDDGSASDISYTTLRAGSPSAETRGHGASPPPDQPPIPPDINVTRAEPIGRYALRIFFTDGHDSGYYTWNLLRELAGLEQA